MAEKQSKATPVAQDKKRSSLLRRRVEVSGSGKLARTVRLPRWIRAIGGYFVGSWRELRQVNWPTRKATWSMTVAVILFTLALTIIILLLDLGFEQLFKKVLL